MNAFAVVLASIDSATTINTIYTIFWGPFFSECEPKSQRNINYFCVSSDMKQTGVLRNIYFLYDTSKYVPYCTDAFYLVTKPPTH